MCLDSSVYMLVRHIRSSIKFSPLFIISCPVYSPHHLLEAGMMNFVYSDTAKPVRISDKLRYYRHKKALLQKEVAEYAGIYRGTYSSYEESGRVYYPKEVMEKIAEILGVELSLISDDYNMFIYNGQGRQITAIRTAKGITQTEFAAKLDIPLSTVKKWEYDEVRISKAMWERYFR